VKSFELKDDSTRARILAMAARLSERPATSRFTLEQLADRLGLHYTAIYHYFDGKDDLELTLIEAICERRNHLLQEAQSKALPALDQLAEFIALELNEPPTDVPVRSTALLRDPFRRQANLALREFRNRIAEHLRRGVSDGSINTPVPEVVAELISRILNRYRNRGESLLSGHGYSPGRIADEIIRVIRHGILSESFQFEEVRRLVPRPFSAAAPSEKGLDRVVTALTVEFNRRGYHGTSIPQVARSIGVSKTSLYKYGASKEQLLYLCARHAMDLIAQVRQVARMLTDDPLEGLLYNLYYARYLRSWFPGPTLMPWQFRSLAREHEMVIWDIHNQWRIDLMVLIERGISLGELRSLEPRLVMPMMNLCSDLPIRCEPVEDGWRDGVAQFILCGIATERKRR